MILLDILARNSLGSVEGAGIPYTFVHPQLFHSNTLVSLSSQSHPAIIQTYNDHAFWKIPIRVTPEEDDGDQR